MAELRNEKELEDYLFKLASAPDEEGSPIDVSGKCFRQVNIQGYGIIDLLFVNVYNSKHFPIVDVTIVELKKGDIDFSAIGQASRYKTAVERYLGNMQDDEKRSFEFDVRCVLVGSKFSDGDVCFLVDHCSEWLSVWFYNLSLSDGIQFEYNRCGWFHNKENLSSLDFIKKDKQLFREFAYINYLIKKDGKKSNG